MLNIPSNGFKNLSTVFFGSFIIETFDRGRAFGTQGEHIARDKIKDWMEEIGLYNITLESIQNITTEYSNLLSSVNLTEDIVIETFGITLHNQTNTILSEFHIRPTWNWRFFLSSFLSLLPDEEEIEEKIVTTYNFDETLENWKNMVFNENWLTKNVSYQNLSLRARPTDLSWFYS